MNELGEKGLSQLLLSPFFLANRILGTVVPGALLILLLSLKGNMMIRLAWLSPLFGYRTKVCIFLMLSLVVGSILKLPFAWASSLIKVPEKVDFLKGQTPEVKKMFGAVITDGVVLSTPGLVDRLSLSQTEVTFHIGTGMALMVAAFVPGDGSLRWLEGVLGIGMFWAGVHRGRQYNEEILGAIGIGMANVLARMNPQQLALLKAVANAFGIGQQTPTQTIEAVPNPQGEQTESDAKQVL